MSTIFISYAHEDSLWKDELESLLRILELNDDAVALEVWSDTQLSTGDDWQQTIGAIMERASLALLIVTRSFLASEFIRRHELPRLEQRRQSHQLKILPVLAEPCPWEAVSLLRELQHRPTNGQALSKLSPNDRNEELTELFREIEGIVGSRPPTRTGPVKVNGQPGDAPAGGGAKLQLSFRHRYAARYDVEARYTDPSSPKNDSVLKPYLVSLDPVAMGPCLGDPATYGSELERRIFPTGPAQEMWRVARSAQRPLQLRISIDPTAGDLHELSWETLPYADSGEPPPGEPPPGEPPPSAHTALARYVSAGEETWPEPVIRSWPEVALALLDFRIRQRPEGLTDYATTFEALDLPCQTAATGTPRAALRSVTAPITLVSSDLAADHGAVSLSWPTDGETLAQRPADDVVAELARHLRTSQVLILDVLPPAGDTPNPAVLTRAALHLAAEIAATGFCAVVTCAADMDATAWATFLARFLESLAHTGNVDAATLAARAALPAANETWEPAVLSRLRTGQIWFRPQFVGQGESPWDLVVQRIREKTVMPILGPGVSKTLPRSREEIAQHLADKTHFPLARADRCKLRKVAQYIATTQEPASVIREFVNAVRSYSAERYGSVVDGWSAAAPIGKNLEVLWRELFSRRDDDPYGLLARLDAPVYLTTTYHNFLSLALCDQLRATGGEDAAPRDRILSLDQGILNAEVHRGDHGRSSGVRSPPAAAPLVYYLFGRMDYPKSLVLTEDDHFRFLLNFKEQWRSLPDPVIEAFSDSALLFLGFDLESWDFRAIFRAFMELEGSNQLRKIPHVAVQIDPDDDRLTDPERTRDYLVEYFNQISERPLIFLGSTHDFLSELDRRCQA